MSAEAREKIAERIKYLCTSHKHRYAYCSDCMAPMVFCGYCGNNSCNGGSGEGCPDQCQEAYKISMIWRLHPLHNRVRARIAHYYARRLRKLWLVPYRKVQNFWYDLTEKK